MNAALNLRSTLESCRFKLKVFQEVDLRRPSSLSGAGAGSSGLALALAAAAPAPAPAPRSAGLAAGVGRGPSSSLRGTGGENTS